MKNYNGEEHFSSEYYYSLQINPQSSTEGKKLQLKIGQHVKMIFLPEERGKKTHSAGAQWRQADPY